MTAPTRNWKFTYGFSTTGTMLQPSTDFWVEYKQSGEPGRLEIVLHSCWEYAKFKLANNTNQGFRVRTAVEDRLLSLQQLVGRTGLLDIDYDQTTAPSRKRSFDNVTLESVNPTCAESNRLFEYDITFGWATAGQQVRVWSAQDISDPTKPGAQIDYRGDWDRTVQYDTNDAITYAFQVFVAKQANKGQPPSNNAIWNPTPTVAGQATTTYYVVPKSRQDRTAFKPVFRNADIRIRAAKGLETIKLQGIRQGIVGNVDGTASKVAAQKVLWDWVDRIGSELLLTIEGGQLGLCHLQDVQPGKLDLPDAVTFELTFVRGYING